MFAILGATGKIGRSTIVALRKAGAQVRAVVRDPAKGADLAALGCEIAVADLASPAALRRALDGASTVQVICPTLPRANEALAAMTRGIEAVAEALDTVRPETVLAISDYGAQVGAGTGITMVFHALEARLRRLSARLIFLRSAEHMENWARVIEPAARTGLLPSFHQPLTKVFPTVSAFDVGAIAADLLLSPARDEGAPSIVHVEGPRRYTPADVAQVLQSLLGRKVAASEIDRAEWGPVLRRGGLSASYVELITELYDAHNAGRIDVEAGVGSVRYGKTELVDALRPLVTINQ